MSQIEFKRGRDEIDATRRDMRGLLVAAFAFSVVVNVLMLTGPLYMLQVYDRVLGSRSEPTLWALTALMAFMFLIMGILDYSRGRIMARVGARMQERLDRRVFAAALKRMQQVPGDPLALAAQRDLEAVQRLWASPVLIAVFDIPFAPMFVAAIFVFHQLMGWLAVAGGVLLVVITVLNQWLTKEPLRRANAATLRGEMLSDSIKSEAEAVQALGMTNAAFDRWQVARKMALVQGIAAADMGGVFGTISKTFRQFLQSAMLGVGAYLVLRNEMGSGAMITGSILLGRAL